MILKVVFFVLSIFLSSCQDKNRENSKSPEAIHATEITRFDSEGAKSVKKNGEQESDPALIKEKIEGVWALVGMENANFIITKNKITYPEIPSSFRYSIKSDSIFIDYESYRDGFSIEFKNTDTMILRNENDEQIYYRFKR